MHSDVMGWARTYTGAPFHALLCDPPYELGFMGATWDSSGIAFRPETWAALAAHLHPGAFLMAFASTRGWHRMAVALEDAGLVMHPSILCWAFAQGFPKATRIERTLPDDERSARFAGHRYGGQAIKPAVEPILIFQKPSAGKVVQSIVGTGAGALWIEGARIGGELLPAQVRGNPRLGAFVGSEGGETPGRVGRWPANFVLVHTPDCVKVGTRKVRAEPVAFQSAMLGDGLADASGFEVDDWRCVAQCPARKLGEQADGTDGHRMGQANGDAPRFGAGKTSPAPVRGVSDVGTAERFFLNADWSAEVSERLLEADPVRYEPKSDRAERDAGLEHLPLVGVGSQTHVDGVRNLDGRITMGRNPHPTVKPIALARWLATLLLPPAEYAPRRLLVPFAGVGSEMIGALKAGWEEVVGIEGQAEYVRIAEQRIEHHTGEPALFKALRVLAEVG